MFDRPCWLSGGLRRAKLCSWSRPCVVNPIGEPGGQAVPLDLQPAIEFVHHLQDIAGQRFANDRAV